jgi:hypothetical protein
MTMRSKTDGPKKSIKTEAPDIIAKRIGSALADIKPGEVVFVIVPAENSMVSNIETLRHSFTLGYKCVYVSLNRDVGELLRVFNHAGLDTTRIVFIDGIGRLQAEPMVESKNVVYVTGPTAPREILDALARTMLRFDADKKMVYIDSLNSILMFNTPEKTRAFITALADLMRQLNAVGVSVSVSIGEHDLPLLAELKSPRKVVDLTKPQE